MSNGVPIQLVIAAFQDEKGADQALDELKAAKWAGLIGIKDAAVIRKDKESKLHIKETGDMGGGKGAVIGGVVGAIVGLAAGPVGVAALAGGALGGLAAKLRDGGFPDARLKEIGEALQPSTSAIVAVVEHKWVKELEKELAAEAQKVVTESVKADIAQQLEEGRQVAYTAVEAQGGVVLGRVAAGDDEAQVSAAVITDEGVAIGAAVVKPEDQEEEAAAEEEAKKE